MNEIRRDPIQDWAEVSARAAAASGYRSSVRSGVRPIAGWSIGALAVAVAVVVVGIALRPDSGPAGGPATAEANDGMFRLELTTPHGAYAPTDAIEPVATIRYLGPNGETTMYHAASPVGFVIEEIGGERQMDGGMDEPCLRTAIRADTPLTYPFEKAGTTEHGFAAVWYQDPVLRLPVGTWRIRAYFDVSVTDGTAACGGPNHHLEVENVITVRDPAG